MKRDLHDVERRWQLWRDVCAATELLDNAVRRWRDADPQLTHYIWLRRVSDLETQSNACHPRSGRSRKR